MAYAVRSVEEIKPEMAKVRAGLAERDIDVPSLDRLRQPWRHDSPEQFVKLSLIHI